MDYRINAAEEVLQGMLGPIRRKQELGQSVPQHLLDEVKLRREEIDEMRKQHRREYGNRSCRCGAHSHGGDCMCFEDY